MAIVDTTNDEIVTYSGGIDIAPEKYKTLTGTISSDGKFVTGTGTSFFSEIGGDAGVGKPTIDIGRNAWLFNGTDQIRRIVGVTSNTNLVIEKPFTVALSASAVKFVPNSNWLQMGITANGASITVNGQPMTDGLSINFGSDLSDYNVLNPVIINATSGSATVIKGAQGQR